jgi:hypothetical protein
MQRSRKFFLAGVLAALCLMFAVSTASARRLEVSEQKWDAIWTSLEFSSGGTAIRCPVTLLGSFHSKVLSKVSGQLVGYVNIAEVASTVCTGGRARALRETLPWHVRYDSFAGGLPAITSVRIQLVNANFLVEAFGFVSCLYTTSARTPGFGTINLTSGVAESIVASSAELASNTPFCPAGRFSGTGQVRAGSERSTTKITVRLVQ